MTIDDKKSKSSGVLVNFFVNSQSSISFRFNMLQVNFLRLFILRLKYLLVVLLQRSRDKNSGEITAQEQFNI